MDKKKFLTWMTLGASVMALAIFRKMMRYPGDEYDQGKERPYRPVSIVLSMLPLFGTHWQEFALATHRWTALVFAVVVLVHTYLAVRTRIVQ